MTPSSPGVKLTYDDFVQFPDDGLRHELIDGEHYVTPSPNTKHQRISIHLTVLIGGWLERNPIGKLFHAPFDVVFSSSRRCRTGSSIPLQCASLRRADAATRSRRARTP